MQEQFRHHLLVTDPDTIRAIVASSGFFNEEEILIAGELAEERLARETSSYQFVFLEQESRVVGYSCYGHIPGTTASYDLYWIAVDSAERGRGIGRRVLAETIKCIQTCGGKNVYAETSSRTLYLPTQQFYEKNGFFLESTIQDFYDEDDSKLIYTCRMIAGELS